MGNNNLIFSVIWLALLVFLAWPIAWACSWLWILLQVSTVLSYVLVPFGRMKLPPLGIDDEYIMMYMLRLAVLYFGAVDF